MLNFIAVFLILMTPFALIGLVGSVLNGIVLSILWGWFIVPTFGIPQLGIPQAIGICLIASYLTHQFTYQKEDDDEPLERLYKMFKHQLNFLIIKPTATLAFGWLFHLFL